MSHLIYRDDQPREEQREFLGNTANAAACFVCAATTAALAFAAAVHATTPVQYLTAGAVFVIATILGGKGWYLASGHNAGRKGWSWDNDDDQPRNRRR